MYVSHFCKFVTCLQLNLKIYQTWSTNKCLGFVV